MAVENKYVDTNAASNGEYPYRSANVSGSPVIAMATIFEVAEADSDGSVYRLFKDLPATLIPIQIWINGDAIAAATDYDLGFYKPNLGAVIDKDSLLDGKDINAGAAMGSESNGLATLTVDLVGKTIGEILNSKLSNTTKYDSVDLCLTANTVGTAAGTIAVRAIFAQG